MLFVTDVTGSMSGIPKGLATHDLPKLVGTILELGVSDPQIMFAAVGDCHGDESSLQVGQFESSAPLINKWLTHIHLEGGGGGAVGSRNGHESYDLPMYFAAHNTALDCWEKRQTKGYFIMTGDENPYPYTEAAYASKILGVSMREDVRIEETVAELSRTYHPFFIIPDKQRARTCERSWRNLIGDHTVVAHGPGDIVYIAAGLILLTEGLVSDVMDYAAKLHAKGLAEKQVNGIIQALTPYAATIERDAAPQPTFT